MKIHAVHLRGKRVLIFGLGLHGGGAAAARYFASRGAIVRVTDLRRRPELVPSMRALSGISLSYVLGRHRKQDIDWADVLIKNPGVPWTSPYLVYAKKCRKPIMTDIGFFLEHTQAPVVGVTGTKGKSTTASLLAAFLQTRWPRLVLAGNVRYSPLERMHSLSAKVPVVLELSSWQLEDAAYVRRSPHVAIITNVYPDHLNRHQGMSGYVEAKSYIVRFQGPQDVVIANRENPYVKRMVAKAKSNTWWFSKKPFARGDGVFLKNGVIWYRVGLDKRPVTHIRHLHLRGEHNIENALAAIAGALVYAISPSAIRRVLDRFPGLPGRLQTVRQVRGVTYSNDTTSTTPQATIEALRSIQGPIVLIAGGADKKLPLAALCREISSRCQHVMLLPGAASERMKREFRRLDMRYQDVSSMADAVQLARRHASSGTTVLLSPGSASFGLFLHEFDRGDQYVREVRKLT